MTKKEAIEMLKANYPDACFEQLREAVDMAIEALHKTEWNPVSKKSPETGDSILVTYSDEEVGIVWSARPEVWGKYEKATHLIFPIAWMPMPEPYRESGESAVQVVRCRDCEWWKCNPNTEEYGVCKKVSYDDFEVVMECDDFCSYGVRREDGKA